MYPLTHPGRPGEFVLLAAERTVTVTREEHHQDVLASRSGPAVAELRPCRITAGKHAGQDGLEVALDGRRVGELTRLMAQRYRPIVDEVQARGFRAGCEAVLRDDARGIQVELRLPAVTDDRATEPPTDRLAIPPHLGAPAPTAVIPSQRRRPPAPPPPPRVPAPSPAGRRRSRRLLGVTGAVVGVLVLASALGNGSRDEEPASSSSTLPSAVAAPAVPAAIAPSPVTTSAVAAVEPVDEPEVAPTRRSTVQARPPATSKPATNRSTTSKPAPRTVQAAPKPAPEPEPESSGCDPNYDGCVPIASDVDCKGGSGNGPAYVAGPVRVIGTDKYGLDNDKDGIGCE